MVLSGVNQRSESSERAAADMMADPLQGSLNLDVIRLFAAGSGCEETSGMSATIRSLECFQPSIQTTTYEPSPLSGPILHHTGRKVR